MSLGRVFHCTIVLGKKLNLYGSVLAEGCMNLDGWYCLVFVLICGVKYVGTEIAARLWVPL